MNTLANGVIETAAPISFAAAATAIPAAYSPVTTSAVSGGAHQTIFDAGSLYATVEDAGPALDLRTERARRMKLLEALFEWVDSLEDVPVLDLDAFDRATIYP